jgi:hypothetical protein
MENIMVTTCSPCRGLGDSEIDAINEAIAAGSASSSAASSNSSWLQNLIGGAVTTVEDIFKAKNTVRGVLTQTSPGVFQYVQPEGSTTTLPVTTSAVSSVTASASSGTAMILIGGAALILVFMLAKGKN